MKDWKSESNRTAIAILRVSSVGQKDNTSSETQRREIENYAAEEGLDLLKVAGIVESAKNSSDRKKFRENIEYALRKRVKHILFYVSSREARNLIDVEENENLVKQGRIILHYVKDRSVLHKNSPPNDFFMRDVNAALNKHYSRDLSNKVRDAYVTKAEAGWWPYRHTPLGYIHSKSKDEYGNGIKGTAKLIPDPNVQSVRQVQREFELRSKNYSYDKIRSEIIKEGFIAPTEIKKYNRSTIEKRLKNSLYRGYFKIAGSDRAYPGKHDLIIPKNILELVDKTFGPSRTNKHTIEQAIFADGWIRCSHPNCKNKLTYDPKVKTIKSTGEKKTYHYFTCKNHLVHKQKNLTEKQIWSEFEKALELFNINNEFAEDILKAINETQKQQHTAIKAQSKLYQEQIKAAEVKEDNLFELFSSSSIDKETYQRQLERLRNLKTEYSNQLEKNNLLINDEGMKCVKYVFELAKDAKTLWESFDKQERLNYLKDIVSNPVLDDLTIRFELEKPFALLSVMRADAEWRRGIKPSKPLKS